ncbi:Thoeris anti-defense Tad2 family protein [Rummeliibacillus stabekisii]|uniref:Thoeris anti-defense 2-like domain-containing protein n=1 Tax=Rummeliibacillus stabekisii TaxID=241244 RepID=A0A143H9K5_9BACL|nr:MW1434 family type I TA system toxin [Rummeliibacillus stabekisii]AMW98414.1 hypothetical protein ATY39_02590 [Rummeliibacillus stabekisii]
MNIQEAILAALKEGRGITRESWGTRSILIIPTNTTACMVSVDFNDHSTPRWQPTADDLTANDWYVYG